MGKESWVLEGEMNKGEVQGHSLNKQMSGLQSRETLIGVKAFYGEDIVMDEGSNGNGRGIKWGEGQESMQEKMEGGLLHQEKLQHTVNLITNKERANTKEEGKRPMKQCMGGMATRSKAKQETGGVEKISQGHEGMCIKKRQDNGWSVSANHEKEFDAGNNNNKKKKTG